MPTRGDPGGDTILYTIRSPWQWVMNTVAVSSTPPMTEVSNPAMLPTGTMKAKAAVLATPNTQKRRVAMRKGPMPCTLRLEIVDEEGDLLYAVHGTSAAMDGLEDKDELVRTMQRCRCEHLNISPPSVLIKWDVTQDECKNVVPHLPVLPGNDTSTVAVLKEPMGSRGEGIYFVKNGDDMYKIVEKHRKQALEGGSEFLERIMDQKGRMPAWVLQAEVYPPLLIQGGRKFHIRSYVAVVEKLFHDDLIDVYVYCRHEVRIAPVSADMTSDDRDRMAHITNGALGDTTERVLLHNVPELASKQRDVELFCAQAFKHFLPDLTRRVGYSASQEAGPDIRKFGMAGLDIMVTEEGRLYLLEVNVNPAAPPEHTVQGEFKKHLVGLMQDLVGLTLGRTNRNFIPTYVILNENAQ